MEKLPLNFKHLALMKAGKVKREAVFSHKDEQRRARGERPMGDVGGGACHPPFSHQHTRPLPSA